MYHFAFPSLYRGHQNILSPMAFSVSAGQVLGIVGPNGAGKSTLLRALAGLSSEVVLRRHGDRDLPVKSVGFLPQNFAVSADLSVLDCVLLGRHEALGWRVRPDLVVAARRALAQFHLEDLAAKPMRSLSGGQQQRVLLVQRLFREPQVLALDEPTSALDLHHQIAALSALRAHARERGSVVIAALHDLTLAARFCDQIAVLAEGALIVQDVPDKALSPETLERYWRITPEFLRDRAAQMVVVPHSVKMRIGA